MKNGRYVRRLGACLVAILVVLLAASTTAVAEVDPPPPAEERPDEQIEHEGIEVDVRVSARRVLVPLAIPDVIESGGDTSEISEQIESMLRRSLKLSGYFDILSEDSFFFDTAQEGMSVVDIEFQNWFNVGAQGLIKSAVRENDGEYELDLRLFGVEQGRQINLDYSSNTADSEEGVRAEVNEFINAVIKHFTGDEGPFGSRIAYSRRYGTNTKHIYVMEMDGQNRSRISRTENIHLVPTFGSNGSLYFTNYRDGNPDLYAYRRDGGYERLSNSPGQNTGAAYCDGKLAVTMSRGTANTDIYLVDSQSGTVERQLTDNWAIDVSPTWSPDCSQIAFVSGRSGGAHIFLMNADGSDQRRLTFQGSYNTTPDWSPRGDRIAFSGRDERAQFDLFTVDLDGNIARLTQDQGNNYEPSYSPNGRHIVFTSDREAGGRHLWLMTDDGQVQNRLTTGEPGYQEPAWER